MGTCLRLCLIVCVLTGAVISLPRPAHAELVLSGYFGTAYTPETDVALQRPGGTSLTFADVSWDDKSFSSPPYYGARLGYWFEQQKNWGMALDYTHAKMYADLGKEVQVVGQRGGVSVNKRERLGDTYEVLEFSDGINLLTLNGMYRWLPKGRRDDSLLGRLSPYGIAGLGLSIPHVEVKVEGDRTFEYQVTGFAAQGGGGVNVDLTDRLALFGEYRLTYAEVDADLVGGGRLSTDPWTHHFVLGVSVSLMN